MDTLGSSVTYKPIDRESNTIRLLRLFKGMKYYKDPIRCELFEVPLLNEDDAQDDIYEALSYTWGDATQAFEIVVNGQSTPVTSNLYHALYYLRRTDEDRILWIDAVCINQRDDAERTHQVRRMCHIYKKAREVIIWLGETTKEVELLMDAVKMLDRRVLARPKPQKHSERLQVWQDEGRSFLAELKNTNPEFYELRRQALDELLKRSWFRRTWVVQEAANASKATIQCSWKSAPTRAFAFMPALMDVKTETRSQALLDVMPGPLREQSWWHDDRSLCTLLQRFGQCESTEPCDQIYALLGISSDSGTPDCPLKADYQLDISQAIRNTVAFLAFGEILDPQTYPLPPWGIADLRQALPFLRPRLFEWALKQNIVTLARKLIHEHPRVSVNEQLPCGEHPLRLLICNDDLADMGQVLMECEDLDVNMPLGGFTPLSLAARQGRVGITRLLLTRPDIKVASRDLVGKTPLEHAVDGEHIEVMDTILSCYPREAPHPPSNLSWDHTASLLLVYAAEHGKISAIKLLLQKGVSPDAMDSIEFNTALTMATKMGHANAVEALLAFGANPNLSSGVERQALCIAASNGAVDLVRLLLDAGADRETKCKNSGATILWDATTWSAEDLALEMVGLLANRGADVNAKAPNGETALASAASSGNLAMVKLLISHGADIETKDEKHGVTVIWVAVLYNKLPVVQLLADRGADLQVTEESVPAVLWRSADALKRRQKIVDFLYPRGARFPLDDLYLFSKTFKLPDPARTDLADNIRTGTGRPKLGEDILARNRRSVS
ncbi:hypothetical protein DL769_011324 [Monosporascus sp. CRB-8-3]|nr:hypothetical protein DL769_011324 [Monosporascus sp. CRB-8-3]